MILFSKKFPKRYKRQAKTKVRSEHSPIILGLTFHLVVNSMRKNKLGSEMYIIVYKFMFVFYD